MTKIVTSRRGFLGAMLAAGMAPAVVRAESMMKIAAPKIIVPDFEIWVSTNQAILSRKHFASDFDGDTINFLDQPSLRQMGQLTPEMYERVFAEGAIRNRRVTPGLRWLGL